jgi:hypothetical protein
MGTLEDSWEQTESREYLIYLAFCEILRECPRGDGLRVL